MNRYAAKRSFTNILALVAFMGGSLGLAGATHAVPDGTTNQVQDSGFESGSGPLQPFARVCGNPYIPGEWNAEAATLIVGSSAGVTPLSPDGMLRVNAAGGVASQVTQIIDVSACATEIDGGNVVARYSIWFNSPAAGGTPGSLFQAGDTQNCVGLITPVGGSWINGFNQKQLALAADGDPGTWEELSSSITLPAGTRFLSIQFWENVSEIPAGGVFFDSTLITLEESLFGLPHTPLGQAQLAEDGSGNLIVSNIGSSGEDGVAIQVCNGCGPGSGGPSDFGTLKCPFSLFLPLNGTVAFELDGVWYGGFGLSNNWLRFQTDQNFVGVAIGAGFDEFAVPSGEPIVYEVLLDGVVVYTEQDTQCHGCGLSWGAPIPNSWGAPPIFVNDCAVITSYAWRYFGTPFLLGASGFQIDFESGTSIELPSGQVAVGNAVRIFPQINYWEEDGTVTSASFLAMGTDFQIPGEFLSVYAGADTAAVGQATMQPTSSGLTISNIGSSGEDGLRNTSNDIEDDQFIAYAGSWDPPTPTPGSGDTAMSIEYSGFFGGSEQSLIIDNIGACGEDGVRISPDFSTIGSTNADVAVFSGGTQVLLVENFDLSTGLIEALDPAGLVNPWPTSARASLIDKSTGGARGIGDPFNGIDTCLTWDQSVSFDITGQSPVLGDELRLQPLNPSATFEGIESSNFLLTDFESVTVTGTAFAPPKLCSGDIDGDDDTDVFDFGVFASSFGSTGLLPFTGADLDGDGDTDVFDFGIFATDFGCGSN